MRPPAARVAIIGCGAATELLHLPAFARLRLVPALLVDRVEARARRLAAACGSVAATDWTARAGTFDAAVVALPHHLHAAVVGELLAAGKHVLVEKPLALTGAECDALIAAAEAAGKVLAVGHVRRFQPAHRWLKAALDRDVLEGVLSFDLREGAPFGWPAASDFFWRRETAGGGVMLDLGVHVLDLVLWWFGDVLSVEYRDDNYGGLEADAEARLRLSDYREGVVEVSRTRELRNTMIVQGQRGSLEIATFGNRLLGVPTSLLQTELDGLRGDRLPRQAPEDLFVEQLQDWLAATRGERAPFVPASEAARAVRLIEQLYARARRWEMPWVRTEATP